MAEAIQDATQDKRAPVKGGGVPLVINDIRIQSVNRSSKDIEQWRSAHVSAESVYSPNRSRLYDLYDDVLLDGHLTGIIAKRIDAVLNKPLYYHDKDGKKVAGMDALINSTAFRNVVRKIMETPLWGISGLEFVPGDELAFVEVPRKHIKPKWRIIALEQNSNQGIPYDSCDNIWVLGESADLGLLLKCAPYAIYKRGNMADWANFIEIFGIPMRIIEYDANDEQTKIELKQILDEAGSALALMIPRQASFKTQDGKQANGDGQLQSSFKDALNDEMSIIVLGNTETTTNNSVGSLSKSKVHAAQQLEISKSDIQYTASYLNSGQFQAILKSYGYPLCEGGSFAFSKDIDIAYLVQRIEVDTRMPENLPIADDYWYTTYGIPKPDNYDALKAELLSQKTESTSNLKNTKVAGLISHPRLRGLYSAVTQFLQTLV